MNKLFITIITTILISSCASLNQFVVTPAGKEPEGKTQRFMYSLPQTVFEVKVNYEKRIELPGPYRQFSQKFLGITQYIKEEQSKWAITGISVSEFREPDFEQMYSVSVLKGSFQANEYFELTSKGLVIDPMGMFSSNVILPSRIETDLPAVLEVSMKRNHKEKTDTLFKTMITDTSFVKIPILRKQKSAKTIEQKAEEAANLIIKIRKRRLKLVDGEYGVFPEGQALAIALEELDRTEQEYIALFTGKTYTEKYSRSFYFVPNAENTNQALCKFSEKEGVLLAESIDGQSVTIDIKPLTQTGMEIGAKEGQIPQNSLIYRVPVTCIVTIKEGNNLLFDGRISVYQFGRLMVLPVSTKK